MAVAFEELEGSPTFTFSRKGSEAKRMFLIRWEDIDAFLLEFLPADGVSAQPFPGKEYLVADSLNVEPMVPDAIMPDIVPGFYPNGAKVTVSYKTTELISVKVSIGAEFITFPSRALVWNSDGKLVGEDVQAGFLSPTIEHTITWNFVPRPPFTAIRQCVGHVNTEVFPLINAPRECLLFLGVEASRELTSSTVTMWKMDYKFTEKNNGTVDNPKGWNYFLRPDKEPVGFERADTTGGGFIYPLENFAPLLELEPLPA